MMILKNATKNYGADDVLKSIDLTIEPGQIIGLAGPSGGGKSTLLRCLQGLEPLSSGTLTAHYTRGFMFQDFQLFPHMSVLENLTFAPMCQDKETDHGKAAKALLAKLGLKGKEDALPSQLSGGQKQRVALARCLMMRPDFLLCDEPTSGLDVATIGDVVDLLRHVHSEGISLIIASHDLDFLTQIATRIVVLAQGKIALDMDPRATKDAIQVLKPYYEESL
ncbi:MAG: ATP-binding cassette domain-containing protein [Proteobacteria bacterium]|nr:ATP-binding cassette domain-containing protein [Pseudomonadota bacterium]